MKKLIVLCSCLIVATATNCYATSMEVDLLSAEYHVWGNIKGYYIESGTEFYYTYDITGNEAVSGSVSQPSVYLHACSSAGPYYVMTDAASFEFGYGGYNDAFADATWEFVPDSNNVQLEFEWEGATTQYSWGEIWLNDVTASTEVYHNIAEACMELPEPFDLILGHEYSLRMYAEAESHEDSQRMVIRANFSVPEPATILLLGSGLVALVGFRRKFKK